MLLKTLKSGVRLWRLSSWTKLHFCFFSAVFQNPVEKSHWLFAEEVRVMFQVGLQKYHLAALYLTDSPSPSAALWKPAWPPLLCSICTFSSEVLDVLPLWLQHWGQSKTLMYNLLSMNINYEYQVEKGAVSLRLYASGLTYMVYIWALETVPVSVSDLIAYLTVASVAAELSEEVTGASAVLTSAVWCTAAWDRCSSETTVAVSASITVAIVAALSACTAGAAVVPGATASTVLKSDHDKSKITRHDPVNTRTMALEKQSY